MRDLLDNISDLLTQLATEKLEGELHTEVVDLNRKLTDVLQGPQWQDALDNMKPLSTFVFFWKGNDVSVVDGFDVSQAFSNLGYSAGALSAIDFYLTLPKGADCLTASITLPDHEEQVKKLVEIYAKAIVEYTDLIAEFPNVPSRQEAIDTLLTRAAVSRKGESERWSENNDAFADFIEDVVKEIQSRN